MRFERNVVVACSGLLILVCSCLTLESLKPDSISSGLVVRQVGGKLKPYEKRTSINLGRVQANYKLRENLEGWGRFDFTHGDVKFSQHLTELDVHGRMESLGFGISYYPFRQEQKGIERFKDLSLDFGGELFHADVESITGRIGPFRNKIGDSIFGGGLNIGATYGVKISDSAQFIFSGGYNFNGNCSREVDYDFNGFYGFVGLKINIK